MLLGVATLVAGAPLAAQPAPASVETPAGNPWRALFERDLAYLERTIPTRYIYAVHPGGAEWDALFQPALAQARREAALVDDFGSYRAVLQHFIVSFRDAHLSAYFSAAPRRARWPRFRISYRGGGYVVAESALPDVAVGAEVTACDGRALHDWMDGLAEYIGGPPARETTRAAIARQFLLDTGNPLYALPRSCRVGGRDIALDWRDFEGPQVAAIMPERTSHTAPTVTDSNVGVDDFGANGAWVRIGTMMATTDESAAQFRHLYERAPSLRDRDFVVIDVRGNPGGSYNWFMGFLRAFYGQEYADYHARARLEIANTIYVISPTGADDPGFPAETNRLEVPPDPPMSVDAGPPRVEMRPDGTRLIFMRPPVGFINYPRRPPPNPVRARVFLLTDYGCASACLSFTDELMRFPGVVQIGAETHIDRRSGGWPEAFELPSGLAVVRMGRMVREGRRRGENEAWIPSVRFDGDIADTAAVQRWILDEVLPRQHASSN